MKCECNRLATHHQPNECQSEAWYNALQDDGVRRNLCADCTSLTDKDTVKLKAHPMFEES